MRLVDDTGDGNGGTDSRCCFTPCQQHGRHVMARWFAWPPRVDLVLHKCKFILFVCVRARKQASFFHYYFPLSLFLHSLSLPDSCCIPSATNSLGAVLKRTHQLKERPWHENQKHRAYPLQLLKVKFPVVIPKVVLGKGGDKNGRKKMARIRWSSH